MVREMTQRQRAADGRVVRQYEYPERTVIAADVGGPAGTIHVDTVGERALVVVETADGHDEFEVELPGSATTVETNNGVLTIEVDA